MRFLFSIIIICFMLYAIVTQSTSKYENISWNEERKRWQLEFDFNGKKCKYYFDNEFDATKTRNRVYKKMGIAPQNTAICAISIKRVNYIQSKLSLKNKKLSQYRYKGVYWDKKSGKWKVLVSLKGQKPEYGGMFKDKLDAAKRVNQLCEELGIPQKNPGISAIPNEQYQKKEKRSQYKGVTWHKHRKKWNVQLYIKGEKQKHGGSFKDELDAAKRVNQFCEELEIPLQNPEISAIPNQQYQKKEKISQYKGVTWHKHKKQWCVLIYLKGQKQKYGGMYINEVDGARRVNQLCQELEIPPQNPTISAIPHQRYQAKEKTSQYKGVYWLKKRRKWRAFLYLKGQNQKYCGEFDDELDAAKKVNEVCQTFGIPVQNPGVVGMPTQVSPTKENKSQYKGVTWHKKSGKWYVRLRAKGEKTKCGGYFNDELDAAKRVNQLCEEFRIPPQNPEIITMPNQQYPRDDKKTITNPVISTKIPKTNDDANKHKRKREKEFNDDDKLPVERNYFYDYLLK